MRQGNWVWEVKERKTYTVVLGYCLGQLSPWAFFPTDTNKGGRGESGSAVDALCLR